MAERALLPGDPGRALLLARVLFDAAPRMFNHNRGLWGYWGTAIDGAPLTIQSTGLGGPSAAIVFEELCDLGLRRAVRVGTCTALDGALALGDLVAVAEALATDGVSVALGAGERVAGDDALTAALAGPARHTGLVASTDLFHHRPAESTREWLRHGALAADLQSATLMTLARRRGVALGCLLAVRETPAGCLDADGLDAAGERLGRAALAALG